MTKYFCDGCKHEIIEGIYRVSIYADVPKSKTNSYWDVLMGAASSDSNINESFEAKPMYCEKCKEKIKNFIACGL